jgi:hypothetical protein
MIVFPKQNANAKWTVIFQVNGENDLLEGMKDIYDKIAAVGSSYGHVNFVVLFDGLKISESRTEETDDDNDNEYPCIYYVTRFEYYENAKPLKQYKAQENLANIDNLSFILSEIKASFPADNYAYFYLGHGGPGRTDVSDALYTTKLDRRRADETDDDVALNKRLFDQRPSPQDVWNYQGYSELRADHSVLIAFYYRDDYKELTFFGLSKALAKSGFTHDHRLDFILLDCCWGQLIENSDSFEPVAKYFVASADEMPGGGIGYEGFCEFLIKHPEIRPDQLANSVVAVNFLTNYDDYLSSDEFKDMGVSLTCSSLKNFKPLKEKLNNLSDYLIVNLGALNFPIRKARKVCIDYTYEPDPDSYHMYNIDLLWFLENLQYTNDNIDTRLHNILSDLIAYIELYFKKSYLASNYKEACIGDKKSYIGGRGLTITFPLTLEQFNNPKSIYAQEPGNFVNWKWKDFLFEYLTHIEKIKNAPEGYLQNLLKSVDFTKHTDYFKDFPGEHTEQKVANFFESFNEPDTDARKWGEIIPFRH